MDALKASVCSNQGSALNSAKDKAKELVGALQGWADSLPDGDVRKNPSLALRNAFLGLTSRLEKDDALRQRKCDLLNSIGPPKGVDLYKVSVTSDSATLYWTPPDVFPPDFRYYYACSGSQGSIGYVSGCDMTNDKDATQWTIRNLDACRSYDFWVTLQDYEDNRIQSNIVTETTQGCLPAPDLTVETISWLPSNPVVGQSIDFAIRVRNIGDAIALPSKLLVAFWMGTEGASDRWVPERDVPTLDPQDFVDVRITLDSWRNQLPGTFEITATADHLKIVQESREDNNELKVALAIAPQPQPDLSWVTMDYSPRPPVIGETLLLFGTYTNLGNLAAPSFSIGFEVFREGVLVRQGATSIGGGLAVGGIGRLDIDTGYILWPGSYAVKLKLDFGSDVAESDENNNEASFALGLEVPPDRLRNGRFEQWGEVPFVPRYWFLPTYVQPEWLHRIDHLTGTPPGTGGYYAVLLGNNEWGKEGYNRRVELYQFMSSTSSFTIQFLGYGNNPWGSFSARLEVIWYDAFGNILSVVGFAINRSDNWTSYSYGVDAPAGAAYAKINLVKASWGYAAFDDISIASGCPNCAMGELSGKPVFVAGLTFRTLGDSIAADRQSPQTSNTIRQLNSGSILSCFRRVLP